MWIKSDNLSTNLSVFCSFDIAILQINNIVYFSWAIIIFWSFFAKIKFKNVYV